MPDETTDEIKFPNLSKSILEALELPEEYRVPTKDKGEYTIFVNEEDWEAARILVNENDHDIRVSFNYDTDPALVANIALVMGRFAHMEIYESYRICAEGELLWWNFDKEEWVCYCENDCNPPDPTNTTIH